VWASPWEIGELNNGTKNGKRKDEHETYKKERIVGKGSYRDREVTA